MVRHLSVALTFALGCGGPARPVSSSATESQAVAMPPPRIEVAGNDLSSNPEGFVQLALAADAPMPLVSHPDAMLAPRRTELGTLILEGRFQSPMRERQWMLETRTGQAVFRSRQGFRREDPSDSLQPHFEVSDWCIVASTQTINCRTADRSASEAAEALLRLPPARFCAADGRTRVPAPTCRGGEQLIELFASIVRHPEHPTAMPDLERIEREANAPSLRSAALQNTEFQTREHYLEFAETHRELIRLDVSSTTGSGAGSPYTPPIAEVDLATLFLNTDAQHSLPTSIDPKWAGRVALLGHFQGRMSGIQWREEIRDGIRERILRNLGGDEGLRSFPQPLFRVMDWCVVPYATTIQCEDPDALPDWAGASLTAMSALSVPADRYCSEELEAIEPPRCANGKTLIEFFSETP